MKFKKIILVTLLLFVALTISAISATDNYQTNETINLNEDSIDEEITVENNEEYILNENKDIQQQDSNNLQIIYSNNDEQDKLGAPTQKDGWNVEFWVSSNSQVKNTFDISEKPIHITINVKNSNSDFSSVGMKLQCSLKYPSGKTTQWNSTLTLAQQTGFESSYLNELGTYTVSVKSEGYSLSGSTYSFKIINKTAEEIKNKQSQDNNYPDYDDYDDFDYEEDESGEKIKIKAPNLKVKYKSKKYFKVTLKYKNGSPIKHSWVTLKIWTGKKSKTYDLKTNSKGIIKFSTKKLKLGTHKVKIEYDDWVTVPGYYGVKYSKIIVKKTINTAKKTSTKKKTSKKNSKYTIFKSPSGYKWKIKTSTWKKMKKQATKHRNFFKSVGSYHPGYSDTAPRVKVTKNGRTYSGIAYAVKNTKYMRCEIRGAVIGVYISNKGDQYV